MTYRFSATSGNIVRPIESLCLNTSTGSIITPYKYGPNGTAITMWNGSIEFYTSRIWPVYATYSGTTSGTDNVRDETGLEPSTQYASYTTAMYVDGDSYMAYSLSGVSGKTIKVVYDCDVTSENFSRAAQWCYMDCGMGVRYHDPGANVTASGSLYFETSSSLYGTYTAQRSYTSATSLGKTYFSFTAPYDTTYFRIRTVSSTITVEPDPCCPGSGWDIYGAAIVNVYVICAD